MVNLENTPKNNIQTEQVVFRHACVYVCAHACTYVVRKGHEFEGEKGGVDRRAVWEVCRKFGVQSQTLQKIK